MTAICTHLDRQLARATCLTGHLKQQYQQTVGLSNALAGLDFLARGVSHVWRNRRYFTIVKLLNMAAVNIQFAFKTERVIGRPYLMKIESTNICNTKCQLCPTGQGLQARPKGKMQFDQFQALIRRFKRHLLALDLSMWGDPLIVPDIFKMIRHAHDNGIWTYISSNLHAYKLHTKPGQKSQAELLVESGLDLMTCSLHGASQQTYEMYQPGKDFDEAIAKIRQIIETRDRMGSKTPFVQLNFVVMRQNEHERQAFDNLAADLGCKAVFSRPSMNTRFQGKDQNMVSLGLSDELLKSKTRKHLEKWLPQDPEYRLASYDQMLQDDYRDEDYNGRKTYFCDWLWRQAVVNWDGNVSTCCGSFEPSEDMGNVLTQKFSSIWNGRKYRLARRSFKKKLSPDEARGNSCATCPGFMV
jgi:radical SAM protein with 4Fe4S-binding SPASM domain